MNNEEFDKKWDSKYHERVSSGHDAPSPETRERLAKLETNQINMSNEITEIKEIVKKFDEKLDNVIECKADKKEVDDLTNKVESINNFMWKIIGIGIVISVIIIPIVMMVANHLI